MRYKDLFNKKRLKVEIAETPSTVEKGLMFRKHLDADSGMLFKFNKPRELRFWGVNTYIPLSIAFVSPDNKIVKITDIKPLSEKVVSSEENCNVAIEANLDYFEKNKIGVGSKINVITENDDSIYVIFPID